MTVAEQAGLRRGPLDGLARELRDAGNEKVRVEPLSARAIVNLRGRPTEAGFAAAIRAATGIELPLDPNRWTGDNRRSATWLGPDESLLMASDADSAVLEHTIRDARVDDPWLSVVDVSQNYICMVLSGSSARDLLAKGCSLDLGTTSFRPRDCAQTTVAKTRAILRAMDDGQSIELWVRNSFADYAARWLMDAAVEFGPRRSRS